MDIRNVDPNTVEKIERLSDILVEFGYIPLLNKRLSLYGGTALNFLHFSDVPRLSEDLDYNYRHFENRDWGIVREEIDNLIKQVLDKLGYLKENIKIQSRYNQVRFHIHYMNRMGKRDALKIEIGYIRRIPVLDYDIQLTYNHPIKGSVTKVLTPKREELLANKICTLISRGLDGQYPRDIFDVYTIAKNEIDLEPILDIAMIEALMSDLELTDCKLKSPNKSLYYGLSRMLIKEYDLDEVFNRANDYLEYFIGELEKRNWPDFKEKFINTGKIDLQYLNDPSKINSNIESHPQLLWIRHKMKI